jgi:ribosomal protein S27AE
MPSFAASLDAHLTREPDYDEPLLPGDPGWPHCTRCGGFLTLEPHSREPHEITEECDGNADTYDPPCGETPAHKPHIFVAHAWDTLHRTCTRCGHDNLETD